MRATVTAGDPLSRNTAFCDWLRQHDIDPEVTWRVAIFNDTMRVYQYATDDAGELQFDPDAGPEHKPPFDVAIKADFPEDIWIGAPV